jgi:hypothetical protein
VQVTTGVERRAAQFAANEIIADCRSRPRQNGAVEKLDVGREGGGAGRQPDAVPLRPRSELKYNLMNEPDGSCPLRW